MANKTENGNKEIKISVDKQNPYMVREGVFGVTVIPPAGGKEEKYERSRREVTIAGSNVVIKNIKTRVTTILPSGHRVKIWQ